MKNSRGFTLIELMVAMVIGLLIVLVVTQAYLSGVGTQQAQSGAARAQEAGRVASDIVGSALRKAGYMNLTATGAKAFCFFSTTANRIDFVNDRTSIGPSAADFSGTTATLLNSSDVLRVRYSGEGGATADGSVRDCIGNAVGKNTRVEETFYVKADTNNDGEPALFCYSSNSGTEVALVPGVESFQLLYGVDINESGAVSTYRPGTSANIPKPNLVRSVMVSFVTRTKEVAATNKTSRTMNHFGTGYAAANVAPSGDSGSVFSAPADGRIRLLTTIRVAMRNLCPV